MPFITHAADEVAGLFTAETLLLLGVVSGAAAVILLAVAMGIHLIRHGRLSPVRGRETRIDPSHAEQQ
jgi:hypothetical protein